MLKAGLESFYKGFFGFYTAYKSKASLPRQGLEMLDREKWTLEFKAIWGLGFVVQPTYLGFRV